ncbi:hypothetical protein [Kordiimonas marina]|uniref:hypothetical protein n=1 Tax=Kordiimonas marina TaxID=2872312 RepID=UPI001FF40772|nr:hypothetical protein [Kordiimonas marina]MCJ9427801.1 hypothetical protein [Kordiimonas marina]
MRLLAKMSLVTILLMWMGDTAVADVPEKFLGKWTVYVTTQDGFPWWEEVKYPKEIYISNNGGYFIDQMGNRCDVADYYYDVDIDSIVLKNCGQTKSSKALPPFHLISEKGGFLVGRVQTYKLLFEWRGKRDASGGEKEQHW